MQKTITDFVEYSYCNIVWFAFNFVLVMMPLICIFVLNPNASNIDIAGAGKSYTSLLLTLCIANLI